MNLATDSKADPDRRYRVRKLELKRRAPGPADVQRDVFHDEWRRNVIGENRLTETQRRENQQADGDAMRVVHHGQTIVSLSGPAEAKPYVPEPQLFAVRTR